MKKVKMKKEEFRLKLRGKTAVFIDWANVHGWEKSLRKEINIEKLYEYLKGYKGIEGVNLYFGTDKHEKSKAFLKEAEKVGFKIITKPVKYVLIAEIKKEKVYRRKCDFDMEMCIDTHQALKEGYQSFVFLTGDGDFEPLYKMLISLRKQVVVIFAHGHMGREIYQIKKGIFTKAIDKLGGDLFA